MRSALLLPSIYAKLSDRIEVPTEWLSWADKSGPEWFLFPHTIDLARWLIGKQKVKKVFALGKKGVLQSRGIDCVINNKSPEPSGEDGLAVTEIIEAIVMSLTKSL